MHWFEQFFVTDPEIDASHAPVEDLSEKLVDVGSSFMIYVGINDEAHFKSGLIDPRRIIHVLPVSQIVHAADGVEDLSGNAHIEASRVVFSDLILTTAGAAGSYKGGHAVIDGFE